MARVHTQMWFLTPPVAGAPSPTYLLYHPWEPRQRPTVLPTSPVQAQLDYVEFAQINELYQVVKFHIRDIIDLRHGKGCGTWPQFNLMLTIIEIPPSSIQGRPLYEEIWYMLH